jgi:hypothetical protein
MTSGLRKSISKSIPVVGSSTELNGLLTGAIKLSDAATALKPVSKVPFHQIHPSPLNPRYEDLCTAHVIQPKFVTGSGTPRHSSATHINKLSRNRALEWAQRVRDSWLKSEPGKAWLAAETKSGHQLNFVDPDEKQKDALWKAYMRRWIERVDRMLSRQEYDEAGKARLATLLLQWNELIALSATVMKDGLMSPVGVRPVGGQFEIVGGERRYWACRLGSMDFIPVVGQELDDLSAMSRTIHENWDRLDISTVSKVRALRRYFGELTGEPCGPRNKKITISLFENEFAGRSKSFCHRWRGICRLPEDSELLADICSGAVTGINNIDNLVRAFHKELKSDNQTSSREKDQDNESNSPSTTPKPPSPPKQPPGNSTSLKVRPLGTEAGLKVFAALKSIDGVSDDARETIEKALSGWRGAPDKQRKKFMEEVLSTLAEALDPLDEVGNDS